MNVEQHDKLHNLDIIGSIDIDEESRIEVVLRWGVLERFIEDLLKEQEQRIRREITDNQE
jgi:hypothetical protein